MRTTSVANLLLSGKSNGGSQTGAQLSTISCNCHHVVTKIPFMKGPKRQQKCTIADDCAQVAESGLKPPI